MRVEGVKRPHERIGGKEPRILPMQEQRQPVGLVAVEAVIAPEGQVKTKQDCVDQPSRAARPGLRANASPDIAGLLPHVPRG